jgi:hypothetical protein
MFRKAMQPPEEGDDQPVNRMLLMESETDKRSDRSTSTKRYATVNEILYNISEDGEISQFAIQAISVRSDVSNLRENYFSCSDPSSSFDNSLIFHDDILHGKVDGSKDRLHPLEKKRLRSLFLRGS